MKYAPSDKQAEELRSGGDHEQISRCASVAPEDAGLRLDQAAARLFPEFSRARLQEWIKDGSLSVDGRAGKVRDKALAGTELRLEASLQNQVEWQAEAIPLNICHEDADLMVIDKPAGLTVHPAAGLPGGTLANAVLAHCPANAELPRAGIVHRLDKDTTGLMVVAKSLPAHTGLVAQLQDHSVSRCYRAIVCGELIAGGSVNLPVGRHPTARTKMAVREGSAGKPAVTHYRIATRLKQFTELNVELETGRTHQIRVHMAHLRYPLLGDPVYNARYRRAAGISDELDNTLKNFRRQALHAANLRFT
ncbi:MAG: 23S rRNA pseudouridine(1911/1915/1917) synthase RluD, partial [Pseudomonadales bacterium]|nr:23S rRNA pseudouridine(1911/1915/1917) synthase RluD [Pseudomonadales bacterium]